MYYRVAVFNGNSWLWHLPAPIVDDQYLLESYILDLVASGFEGDKVYIFYSDTEEGLNTSISRANMLLDRFTRSRTARTIPVASSSNPVPERLDLENGVPGDIDPMGRSYRFTLPLNMNEIVAWNWLREKYSLGQFDWEKDAEDIRNKRERD